MNNDHMKAGGNTCILTDQECLLHDCGVCDNYHDFRDQEEIRLASERAHDNFEADEYD